MEDSFRRLGVDARVGEIPGEYCPGAYSVKRSRREEAHGSRSAPCSQCRPTLEEWWWWTVESRVRDVLLPVYRHLGFDWDPETAGQQLQL